MKKYYETDKVIKEVGFEPIPDEVRAAYLRPGELLSIQQKFPVAYQPVGTLEWHGRQNPIGCDAIKAEKLCIEAAKITGGAVMPAIFFATDSYRDRGYGVGLGMDAVAGFQLPGSFYKIDNNALKTFMSQACANYLARGFKLVIIVSGHNAIMQEYLFSELCYDMKTNDGIEPVFFIMEYAVLEAGNPRRHSDHAGFYETSMMMYLNGDRVNMLANEGKEKPELAVHTVSGVPLSKASAGEGEIYFELQVKGLSEVAIKKFGELNNKI